MMPKVFMDAYHKTDAELVALHGLTSALLDIIRETTALNQCHRDAAQISALMSVIEEKAEAATALHEAEWSAFKGETFVEAKGAAA